MTRTRPAPILLVLLLAFPLVLASPQESGSACPAGLREMEDVGLVCPRENGLFEVFASDMTSLGTIHGRDPVPAGDRPALETMSGTSPNCVSGAPGTYHIQVIYARAFDDADQYNQSVAMLRQLTEQANRLVDDAGIATGSPVSLNVKCVGGIVEVRNEVLPTAKAFASFSTITSDLRARGYNDGRVKYWIYYDDTGACSCGGMGNVYGDERLSSANWNNGNGGPMYAITFGYSSTRIWLHELGHNMGAVQNNAPHTSGGYHCNDGRDIMCYGDGGSNSSYTSGACAVEVWDCNRDTYFHARPPPGSYLATNWNLASPINRFVSVGVPSLTELACTPRIEVGNATTCTFLGHDDSNGVRYAISWGDGADTLVPPAPAYATPGETQTTSHAYLVEGAYDVTVTITDATGTLGNTLTARVDVLHDLTPPTVSITEPVPNTIYRGCHAMPSPVHLSRALWLERACVKATAQDNVGVARVELYIAGIVRAVDEEAPYVFEVPVPHPQINTPIHVAAYDAAGNRHIAAVSVDMVPPLAPA